MFSATGRWPRNASAGLTHGRWPGADASVAPANRIEVRLLGPLVGEDESDVGLVGCHRGDTGIHIHVIPDGNIIVAFCGVRHIPLAENGVDKAVVVHSVIIVLLHNQIRVIDVVHPVGDLLIILALPGNGVHQNGPLDVRAAEEAMVFTMRGQTQ